MAERQSCDGLRRAQTAHSLGFVQGEKCTEHAETLSHPQISLYDDSMKSPGEEESQELIQRGLDSLTWLGTACASLSEEGNEQMQGVHAERPRRDNEAQIHKRYEEICQDLSNAHRDLREIMQNRHCQLSYEHLVLCEATHASLLFRLVKGGCRLPVAQALVVDFHFLGCDMSLTCSKLVQRLEQLAGEGVLSDCERAITCSRYLTLETGLTLQQCESLVRKLQFLFTGLAEKEAKKCLSIMQEANHVGEFGRALEVLQHGKDILRTMEFYLLYLQLSVSMVETLSQAARW